MKNKSLIAVSLSLVYIISACGLNHNQVNTSESEKDFSDSSTKSIILGRLYCDTGSSCIPDISLKECAEKGGRYTTTPCKYQNN